LQVLADVSKVIQRLASSAIAIKNRMKDEEIPEELARCMGKVDTEKHARLYQRLESARQAVLLLTMNKRARGLFGDEIKELDSSVKELLTRGALLTKYNDKAKPGPRFIVVDADLQTLSYVKPGKQKKEKAVHKQQFVTLSRVASVGKGRCTKQLEKKSTFRGRFVADDSKCFAILSEERTLSLECDDEEQRDAWVTALELCIKYQKERARQALAERESGKAKQAKQAMEKFKEAAFRPVK